MINRSLGIIIICCCCFPNIKTNSLPWIIITKDVNVCSVYKFECQYINRVTSWCRPNDSYVGRIVSGQSVDIGLRPTTGLHSDIVVKPVEILHVVDIRRHHGVVLCPRRPASVIGALDQSQCDVDE